MSEPKQFIELCSGAWDTHVHLFNPSQYPFRENRSYTPSPAYFEELVEDSPATNFTIVQASVEDGIRGVLNHLESLSTKYPSRQIRGTLLFDATDAGGTLAQWSPERTLELHALGVRCLRVHGKFGNLASDATAFTAKLKTNLLEDVAPVVRRHGWKISMQLPLQVWASLESFLDNELTGISVIAEHCASISCPLDDALIAAFDTVCGMMRRGRLFVKLGALHRRATNDSLEELHNRLSTLAEAGPRQLLWGSDWPHVDSSVRSPEATAFLPINAKEELEVLRRTMSDEAFHCMLYTTPEALFRA